ncbi:DUF881 domain-containing protein [Filifactor villosus]|uniref:DUF881 domain-containing protein n=1 Tax=Filifactor villosus TaxID=29374 RepID=A0ABV9QJB5_9FIRM
MEKIRDFKIQNYLIKIKSGFFMATVLVGLLLSFQINSPINTEREISYTTRVLANQINREKLTINYLKKERKKAEKDKRDLQQFYLGDDPSYEKLKEQLDRMKLLTGEYDVQGEGVILRIDSGTGENIAHVIESKKVLILLLNELKVQGAEVISLNGQRVGNQSGITLAGNNLDINNTEIAPTYEIRVIGNSKQLYLYLKDKSVIMKFMKDVYQFKLSLKQSNNVLIEADPYRKKISTKDDAKR